MAMLIGFVLPTSQKLYEALEQYLVTAYESAKEGRMKRNIKYAHNRLVNSYPHGERRYCPMKKEYENIKVRS